MFLAGNFVTRARRAVQPLDGEKLRSTLPSVVNVFVTILVQLELLLAPLPCIVTSA